jgi:hypothetical protein
MVHVDLSEEECAVLRDLLATRSQDLGHEIHHTDSRDFRAELRRQEHVLHSLLARLAPEPAHVTH